MKRIVGHGMKKNQECTKAAEAFTRNWAIQEKKILKHHYITYGFCHSEAMAN